MDSPDSNSLHGDGTTSSGKNLTFGLAEISGGDAASTLQCFNEAVDDLCDTITPKSTEYDFAKLVTSIKSTMSDLGPVNPVFNCQLKALREELLPKMVDNWDGLSHAQRNDLADMGNVYCKLHVLVNFANFATETDKY